jgi:hypothetical protein
MRRSFTINTEPHVAEVGEHELLFQPEVMGDEFLDAYTKLREVQSAGGVDVDDLANLDPAELRKVTAALRVFLAGLMLPESAEVFARWEVKAGSGKAVLGTYGTPEEAEAEAAKKHGAKVTDASLRLPDRVLVELLEWVVELYGSGATARPTGSSSGSAQASPSRGMRGRAGSPSRG